MPANAVNAVMQKITAIPAILLRLVATVLSSIGIVFSNSVARRYSTSSGYSKSFFREKPGVDTGRKADAISCLTAVHPGGRDFVFHRGIRGGGTYHCRAICRAHSA